MDIGIAIPALQSAVILRRGFLQQGVHKPAPAVGQVIQRKMHDPKVEGEGRLPDTTTRTPLLSHTSEWHHKQ